MIVVVLGMHRSGTSATAGVLHHLGVRMGDHLLEGNRWNPDGYYEDAEILMLNIGLLRAAGGSWARPPAAEKIDQAATFYDGEIRRLVRQRMLRGPWGWKDPRTCLTIGLYHRYLEDPRYVYVTRKRRDVVASLMRRHAEDPNWWLSRRGTDEWARLADAYNERAQAFLERIEAPVHLVQYEDLVARPEGEVVSLAAFVGVQHDERIRAAARTIRRGEG